jgi:hypothetical protein
MMKRLKILIFILVFFISSLGLKSLMVANHWSGVLAYSHLYSGSAEASGISRKTILARRSITIAATGTTFDVSLTSPGECGTRYILECPDMVGNGTITLSVIDANSKTIYNGAAHAENSTYSIPIDLELVGTYTLRLTLSVAAGGTGATAYLTILGF